MEVLSNGVTIWPSDYSQAWTLAAPVECSGVGLHSGAVARLRLEPYEQPGYWVAWLDDPSLPPQRLHPEQVCETCLRLREITLCDPHFAFWPLSQERVLSALTAFVKLPGRRLVLVAQGYDHLRRRHPRFLRWRAVWGHAVTPLCFQDPSAELPSVLLADRAYALRLQAPDVWSGAWVTDRQRLIALVEQVAMWRQQSHPDLPINLTGL